MEDLVFKNTFAGGSLNTIIPKDDCVIKLYKGPIPRGSEKLRQEYLWLEMLPGEIFKKYPYIFPRPISIHSDPTDNETEIKITKIPRISLTKSILNKEISVENVSQTFECSLELLRNVVFPIRTGEINPYNGYYEYHAKRIALARRYLRELAYFQPILNAREMIINGVHCPTINQFLAWLDDNAKKIFVSSRLFAVHGNFHFDNILVAPKNNITVNDVSFIDPRGDRLGFPHYDFAKILTSIESYYDEIHYGLYDLDFDVLGNCYSINIKFNNSFDQYYAECFKNLDNWVVDFMQSEGIDKPSFMAMVHTVHCIHILSFTFYHAYQEQYTDPNRIRAYIAMLGLLCKRLFKLYDSSSFDFVPSNRLFIGDRYGNE